MIKTTINEIIQLHPSFLSKDLVHNVTNEIVKRKKSKCFQKYGYVLGVENVTVGKIMISNCTGLLDCSVRYVANCLHPKPNSVYQGRVCLIFHLGVLVVGEPFRPELLVISHPTVFCSTPLHPTPRPLYPNTGICYACRVFKRKKSGRSRQREVKKEVKIELDTIRGIRSPNAFD